MTTLMTVAWTLVLAMAMLAALDWRIQKSFKGHEEREERMHANTLLLADTAVATAREAGRQILDARSEISELRIDMNNIGALIKIHNSRLESIEDKLVRASLMVPQPRRPPEG